MLTKTFRIAAAAAFSVMLAGVGTVASAQPWGGWGPGYGGAPWGNSWGGMPWGNGPFNASWGPGYGAPYNSGWGGMPWGNGWGGNPWGGNRWNNGPWNSMPFMGNLGPDGGPAPFSQVWPNPTDPKGTLERIWDESLNAPSRMGRMPGGWKAPSISVPNPVDVADQLGEAAWDAPGQFNNFNFR